MNMCEDTSMRFIEIPYSHGAIYIAGQDMPEVFGWCRNRYNGGRLPM